jgi:hypothetical protein
MDDEPIQPAPGTESQPDNVALRGQLESLQRVVTSMLLLLIVVSGTLWIFLKRQLHNTEADIKTLGPAWTNSVAQYQHNSQIIEQTVKKLQEFARTNADFAPILNKYGLSGTLPSATNATASAKKGKK